MKDTMDEVLKQEAELIRLVEGMQEREGELIRRVERMWDREGELIGLVKDMQDREKRVGNLLLKIAKKLNNLELRIEKLEGRDDE